MIECGINVPWDEAGQKKCWDLGARRARLGWEDGPWVFSQLEGIVKTLHKIGFKITLAVTPNNRKYGGAAFEAFNIKCAGLLDFPKGDILEYHNENNHVPFAGTPDAKLFANAYAKTQKDVRTLHPDAKIILGGLSVESGPLAPKLWLPACINANKDVLKTDGFAMHPYEFPWDPRDNTHAWNPVGYLTELDNIWRFCGRPNMPFHLTEFSAPSGLTGLPDGTKDPNDPQAPYRYNQAFQAEWLVRYLEAFAKSPANIVSAQWYTLNDGEIGTATTWDPFTGLRAKVNGQWVDKPVAQVFRAWAASVNKK